MIISEMIKDSGALKVGSFILSSGKKSSYYVDKYLFETSPGILKKNF
jgi:orotate phosphoribosyltransferase (EC 2.4.2.10)